MKSIAIALASILVSLVSLSGSAHAWCWFRDTGSSELQCTQPFTSNTSCPGHLRRWPGGSLQYHISSTTDPGLITAIQTGVNLWNAVEMSTFAFQYNGTSPATIGIRDGINIIGINPSFSRVGQGILAISTTWTKGARTTDYRAVESDIELNGAEFSWGDGTGRTRDAVAIVTHEAGYCAGLNHAGIECLQGPPGDCGVNGQETIMYWRFSTGTMGIARKGTPPLDATAALIYGYPTSTFSVAVVDSIGDPVSGATVTLLDAAAPMGGETGIERGRVYGDIQALQGNNPSEECYVHQTPFYPTNDLGMTNAIHPTHRALRLVVSAEGYQTLITHALVDGTSTRTIALPIPREDTKAPLITITSHTPGQTVNTNPITLSGAATDKSLGDDGIRQIAVNGVPVHGATATVNQTALWEAPVLLTPGENHLTISATDDAPTPNTSTQPLLIILDATPPGVSQFDPADKSQAASTQGSVSVQFSEPMDASTLTARTFRNDAGIGGTVTYDAPSRTAWFTPTAPFAPLTAYAFTLTTGILDTAGNPLGAPLTWSFTTQGPPKTETKGTPPGCFIGSSRVTIQRPKNNL